MESQSGFQHCTVHWAQYESYIRLRIQEMVSRPLDGTNAFDKTVHHEREKTASYVWKDPTLHNTVLSLIVIYWARKMGNTLPGRHREMG